MELQVSSASLTMGALQTSPTWVMCRPSAHISVSSRSSHGALAMVFFVDKKETELFVGGREVSGQPPEPHDYWERLLDLSNESDGSSTVNQPAHISASRQCCNN